MKTLFHLRWFIMTSNSITDICTRVMLCGLYLPFLSNRSRDRRVANKMMTSTIWMMLSYCVFPCIKRIIAAIINIAPIIMVNTSCTTRSLANLCFNRSILVSFFVIDNFVNSILWQYLVVNKTSYHESILMWIIDEAIKPLKLSSPGASLNI